MKRFSPVLFLVLLVAAAAGVLSACANIEPAITQESKIYRDAPVEKSRLNVAVHPRAPLDRPPKVLMYPFWIGQKMQNYLLVGRELGRIVHQTWTGEDVFPTLEYDPQLVYRGPREAVRVARAAGADLVVVGLVPYLITGGTVDSTAVTLQIRIYEASTGNLLVSMEQSARVNAKVPSDWVLFTVETRLSDSPIAAAIASIARDMAVPLKTWVPPSDAELGFADTADGISRGLLAGDGNPRSSVKLKIEFDFDSARIRPSSYGLINELGAALKSSGVAGRRVLVSGHADAIGTLEYNQKLSERRAASVKAYLVKRCGIAPARIRTRGYGKTRPLVPNTTPANRQRNRRVEVRLDS